MYPLMNSHKVLEEDGVAGLSLKVVVVGLSSLSSKVEIGVKKSLKSSLLEYLSSYSEREGTFLRVSAHTEMKQDSFHGSRICI